MYVWICFCVKRKSEFEWAKGTTERKENGKEVERKRKCGTREALWVTEMYSKIST